jgi:transcription elongation factor Elf1
MPRPPRIRTGNTPLKKTFVCTQCNGKFRSKAGRTRHINAKHSGLRLQMNSPQSEEADHFSDISSYLSPSTHIFSPTRNSDVLNFGAASENDFNFNNDNDIDDTPPLSPSRTDHDMASTSMENHSYLNGKNEQ